MERLVTRLVFYSSHALHLDAGIAEFYKLSGGANEIIGLHIKIRRIPSFYIGRNTPVCSYFLSLIWNFCSLATHPADP